MSEFVPIALLHSQLVVEATRTAAARLHATDRPVRTVFASYATDDRVDVLQWARGAEIAGVDVFLDVLKLRESSRWERELFEHIPTKDLFCLFWSAAASRSHWVDREWRCALEARGSITSTRCRSPTLATSRRRASCRRSTSAARGS